MKIWSNWQPPRAKLSLRAVVLFNVSKKGNINKIEICKSSGDEEFDSIAIKAVQAAAPFQPFPKEYKDEDVDINFTFDYNLRKGFSAAAKSRGDFNGYINTLMKEVDEYLKPYSQYPRNKRVVLQIKFISSGEKTKISHVNIIKSSGSRSFDSKVLSELQKPDLEFSPIPKEKNCEGLTVKTTFSTKKPAKGSIGGGIIGACAGFLASLFLL